MANQKINLVFHKSDNISDEEEDEKPITWINIIFIPFNTTWRFIVLLAVLVKCTMGPLSAVYVINCSENWDENEYLSFIKQCYFYGADLIYAIDTFLYIVHRQVTDEATRREHVPKPALLIIIDLLSLVPFFHLTSNESCPPVQLYPNVLAFNEVLIAYRIVQYFSLKLSHSTVCLLTGYFLLLLVYVNTFTCMLLLLTAEGLCENCHKGIYDWRYSVRTRLATNGTNLQVTKHLYASALVLAITVHRLIEQTRPATYLEFVCCITVMILGYLLVNLVVMPKLFAEGILRMRQIYNFHKRVSRIIEETKRRNTNTSAYLSVEKFYSLIWTKRSGISIMPTVIEELPSYLKLTIKQDLTWPVLRHSPTFRNTSPSFKRWFCNHIYLYHKLPGEEFFVGPHSYSNLYYIKTGIVQLVSSEDSMSSILSLTSGTIFGDISFYVPPLKRNVKVYCLTYVEVFYITRVDILKAMHKFPEDRKTIMSLAKQRMKHALTLHNCKNNIKGLDRKEDEGISWVKRRWWEIHNTVDIWKKSSVKEHKVCKLPLEEANYHCPKFLGQLVLSTNVQLQRKSLFVRVHFPWILAPVSLFGDIWHNIVVTTVYLVLIVLPPVIASLHIGERVSKWFTYFKIFTDIVYSADIIVSIMTAVEKEGTVTIGVMAIFFERCKDIYFILDLLSTAWIEKFVVIIGKPEYYYGVQFNRLLKIYVLFHNNYKKVWIKNKAPIDHVFFFIGLIHFVLGYVVGYFMFMFIRFVPTLSFYYFFGELCGHGHNHSNSRECHSESRISILKGWLFEIMYPEHQPESIADVMAAMMVVVTFFMMNVFTRTRFIGALFLEFGEIMKYYFFVSNLRNHYIRHNIHPNLLRRLERYLECHWKYYRGMDILYPNMSEEVPYDIFSKLHGEVAEAIIGQSQAFRGADPAFIKELSHKVKFLLLPSECTITAFGIHAKNLTWIVKGIVRCEYYDTHGRIATRFYIPGNTISLHSIVLKKASLRTVTAATDCEVLYINVSEFFKIIKSFPSEFSYLKVAEKELSSDFEKVYQDYKKKNFTNLKSMRDNIFHKSRSMTYKINKRAKIATMKHHFAIRKILQIYKTFRNCPESPFIRVWLPFRAVTVVIGVIVAAFEGGSGATSRQLLTKLGYFADTVGVMDIIIKLFLPYYDERGLIISDFRKTSRHYMARGFFIDAVGAILWATILMEMFEAASESSTLFAHTCLELTQVYLLIGYFNYLADIPTAKFIFLMLVKWQIVTGLILVAASQFLVSKCIEIEWDDNMYIKDMTRRNSCWLPDYLVLDEKPTVSQLHLTVSESFILALCALLMINLGKFHVEEGKLEMTICFLCMGCIFWYMMTFSKTLLIIHFRGNTLFQHGVSQLKTFLKSERVNPEVIDKSVNHFVYVWMRTKGIDVRTLMNERIGAVFRQDLSYYFCKKTLRGTDSLLGGGEHLERMLASFSFQIHYLPGEHILRENELSNAIYIVHRGNVVISKDGNMIITLTKGSIFGQLEGTKTRPMCITAHAADYVDVLHLTLVQFQGIINDDIRETITANEESKLDYMAVKVPVIENPYNSIEYFMFKDRIIIKLPSMKHPVSLDDSVWYSRWLFMVWVCAPITTAMLVLFVEALPEADITELFNLNVILDSLHVMNLISEFYMMEIVVDGDHCVKKYIRLKNLLRWRFYLDVISLVVPWIGLATKSANQLQLLKLLRLHSIFSSQHQLGQNFQFQKIASPLVVYFLMVILILHALTCGWIIVACKAKASTGFPVPMPDMPKNASIVTDVSQWVYPNDRKQGCVRCLKIYNKTSRSDTGFVVPTQWYADYLLALSYVVIIQTHTNMDTIVPLSVYDMYYRAFMTIVLYLVEMFISSICISYVYTRIREVYYFDYCVSDLIKYLKQNGLSASLLQSILKYTKLLWQRQRGTWLPELTHLAPKCMEEDLLSALYMHHLENTQLFKILPMYFLRQMVAKLKRVVIFPGNFITHEGDINPTVYFIHEGEVEKWFLDSSKEHRMSALLSGNVYFGLIPGLFPDIPYKFTYYTRTVVDLVYLRHEDWKDLLDCYPDLKSKLYEAANKLKNK